VFIREHYFASKMFVVVREITHPDKDVTCKFEFTAVVRATF
jgi:hypothetical protein